MLISTILCLTLCEIIIKEEEVVALGDIISKRNAVGTEIEYPQGTNEYFYRYFISSFFGDEKLSGLMDLVCDEEAEKFVYTTNVLRKTWLYDEDANIAQFLVEIASVCSDDYLANPYTISPKTDFSSQDQVLENLDSILVLARALDKKAIKIFFSCLDSRKINPGDHVDLLVFLSKKNIYRAYGYLGEVYYYGLGVPKSVDKAMDSYLKGKTGRDPVSYNGIGRILMSSEYEDYGSAKNHFDLAMMSGILNETDYRLYELYTNHLMMGEYGKFYLTKAMSLGFLPAIYKDGLGYFSRKDFASTLIRLEPILDYTKPVIDLQNMALKLFRNKKPLASLVALLVSVELGSNSSIDNAIYILENYRLLDEQDSILFKLYMRQMRTGVTKNLNRIGDCFFYGRGVQQSYTDAFSYYLSSSVYRSTEGMVSVSYMYEKGLGVERNIWKSLEYIRKIRVDDKNYLLLVYLYLSFVVKIFVLNKYILASSIGSWILLRVFNKV